MRTRQEETPVAALPRHGYPTAVHQTALIWDDALARYRFRPGHPMDPRRLELTVSLIRALDLVGDARRPILSPGHASDRDLLRVHSDEYLVAVRRASRRGTVADAGLLHYGLGTEDVPIVEDMHAAARAIVGATLRAAEVVMEGEALRAYSLAGGLHHAMPDRASGFCVYNDLAVAIRWIQEHYGARVMYIDYDAHHGDGVQRVFYNDPDVLTVSFHESGLYLFPATGFVEELGEGEGYGYSVNAPLDAHTGDESFLTAFKALVPELASAFQPDVVVLQTGCDSHVWDPLTHLRCTTGLYEELVGIVGAVADEHCGGRIIATGGGGYAVYEVVPRAWTLTWAALCGDEAPDDIPSDWLAPVQAEAGHPLSATLRDPAGMVAPAPNQSERHVANDRTVRSVRRKVLPIITGWGLGF